MPELIKQPYHFIGLGGAGCNALQTIYTKEISGHFTVISDPTRPAPPPVIQFIPIVVPPVLNTTPTTSYLLSNEYALPLTAAMLLPLAQPRHFVLLVGLGGYTGTRLLETFTQQLQHQRQLFTIIASLPFYWEKKRCEAIEEVVKAYQPLPQFHTIDLNEIAAQNDNRHLNMKAFMQLANEQFYNVFLQHHLQ